MKIYLRADVPDLGSKGEIKEVKRGYFRNFLYPKGLAVILSPHIEQKVKFREERRKEEESKKLEKYQEFLKKLKGLKIDFKVKSTETGKLYDAVDAMDIIKTIKEKTQMDLAKKQIELEKPIKKIGKYKVKIILAEGLETEIELVIKSS